MGSVAKSIIKGAEEALQFSRGKKTGAKKHQVQIPQQIDVKEIRLQLHLTRADFARRFGFSSRTLEKWEHGVRQPDGAARAYLLVIARNPQAVEQALNDLQES